MSPNTLAFRGSITYLSAVAKPVQVVQLGGGKRIQPPKSRGDESKRRIAVCLGTVDACSNWGLSRIMTENTRIYGRVVSMPARDHIDARLSSVFETVVVSLPGTADVHMPIAAARAGATGLLDLTHVREPSEAITAMTELFRFGSDNLGVLIDASVQEIARAAVNGAPKDTTIILSKGGKEHLESLVSVIREKGCRLGLVVTGSTEWDVAEKLDADIVIVKGNEAGGLSGEQTTYVLLQEGRRRCLRPLWAWGGVGRHTAVACRIGGAAGIVLDWQLALARESPLSPAMRQRVNRMDGSETAAVRGPADEWIRVYHQPGFTARQELESVAFSARPENTNDHAWRDHIVRLLKLEKMEDRAWLIGQDAAFASEWKKHGPSVGRILHELTRHIEDATDRCLTSQSLAQQSPMAASQNTSFPVMQGPMTRVSDVAAFCDAIEQGGALPMLALALMPKDDVRELLHATQARMGSRSWGVGILGFVDRELRESQLEVIEQIRPPYAVIAGGRPDQAATLEAKGIRTYLHVPSPGMLDAFLKDGARRFIFEGFECGGHIGPRSSFVLWNSMVDVLSQAELDPVDAAKVHVYFAGGIHDAYSAVLASAIAQPLVDRGMKFGLEMGTAYLFTHEAVSTGAIIQRFQDVARDASGTVLVETGPGHAIRCAPTDFFETFESEKATLVKEGVHGDDRRQRLESKNMGRLRIASKGIARAYSPDDTVSYQQVSDERQQEEGMYMIGQVAGMHQDLYSIRELHEHVFGGASAYLGALKDQPTSITLEHEEPVPPALEVAIVGMGCILPGAEDPETFWRNIRDKRDFITEIPADRFDVSRWYDATRGTRDKIYGRTGGFIDDIVFDPMKYGIPPASLKHIEPAQLLTLELVDRALQDAGYDLLNEPNGYKPRTSVILGVGGGIGPLGGEYATRTLLPLYADQIDASVLDAMPEWTEDSFAGILLNIVAGRVSNKFDLGGVNFTVDAACASSLAAIYLACRELADGLSDMVITGGVDTAQNPFGYMCFASAHALTPSAKPRVFDESADGIVISEGLGAIVLKRLQDAERDGDRIYGVIKAAAGGSDGRSKSMTAPLREGQVRTLRRAYAQARFSPASVGLFEAHGTGTALGDRTECQSLVDIIQPHHPSRSSIAVGSVKSMIGHTKCAAGVAGLIKSALSLYYRTLPASLNVECPNAEAGLTDGPLYVNTETRPWVSAESPRRAGVSSFGFGGTNFHVVVEEYRRAPVGGAHRAVPCKRTAELFTFHAANREGLDKKLADFYEQVGGAISAGTNLDLGQLAYTLHLNHTATNKDVYRAGLVARDVIDLKRKIEALQLALASDGQVPDDVAGYAFAGSSPMTATGSIAFLFPGQGSQYTGMLDSLAVDFAVVSDTLEEANRVLKDEDGRLLSDYIYPAPGFTPQDNQAAASALTQTHIAQPAIGACSLAMMRLLNAVGIRPAIAAGHSYGELTALHSAGSLSTEDFYRLSRARGEAMASTSDNTGTMLVVMSDVKTVAGMLDGLSRVWVANANSPLQTVISGSRKDVEVAAELFVAQGIRTAAIPVACAFHSPLMNPAKDRFERALLEASFEPPVIPVFSNEHAEHYPADAKGIANTLLDQIVSPVRFVEEIDSMYEAGARVFVEVGPGSVLTRLTQQILGDRPHVAIPSNIRGGDATTRFLAALAHLFVEGASISTEELYRGRELECVNVRELSSTEPLGPQVVMVNGAYTRLASAPKRDVKPVGRMVALNGHDIAAVSEPGTEADPHHANPQGTHDAAHPDVLIRWQQTMQRFLETQQQVMQSYLTGERVDVTPPLMPTVAPVATEQTQSPAHQAHEQLADETQSLPLGEAPPAGETGSSTTSESALQKTLLDLVSDCTGYPIEMLDLDAAIEADLGIDSIKRVEILTAFGRELPQASGDTAERFVQATSLREIVGVAVDMLDESADTTPGDASPPPVRENDSQTSVLSADHLMENLKELITDRTGYPPEMLDPTLDLEADFGIDSIKRVEILTAFGKNLHQPPADTAERLAAARSMSDIVDIAVACQQSGASAGNVPAEESEANGTGGSDTSQVGRYVIAMQKSDPLDCVPIMLDGIVLVIDDGKGCADQLQQHITALGGQCLVLGASGNGAGSNGHYTIDFTSPDDVKNMVKDIREEHGRVAGIINLLALRDAPSFESLDAITWQRLIDDEVKGFFYLLQATAADLQQEARPWVIAGICLGGDPNEHGMPIPEHPWRGGLVGLIKTVAVEWPDALSKVIAFSDAESNVVVPRLIAEIGDHNGHHEIYYRGSERWLPQPVNRPVDTDAPSLDIDEDDVVLIIGGARGITAEIAREIANRHKCTVILSGRSTWPADESEITVGAQAEKDVKRLLFESLQAKGEKPTPLDLKDRTDRIMRDREMRETLEVIQSMGARVEYQCADVQNEDEMRRLLGNILKSHGRLNGIICGAGLIEDKLIADKSPDSFSRVLDLKTNAGFVLSRLANIESLKFLVLFSSVAGWVGNRGQADYVAANDILNRLALNLSSQWHKRVVAIDWGPWEKTGMVTDLVKQQFLERGVALVPMDGGKRFLVDEIRFGKPSDALVLALGSVDRTANDGEGPALG
jgi:malonyl CoA-acyl carrier protein transacylase